MAASTAHDACAAATAARFLGPNDTITSSALGAIVAAHNGKLAQIASESARIAQRAGRSACNAADVISALGGALSLSGLLDFLERSGPVLNMNGESSVEGEQVSLPILAESVGLEALALPEIGPSEAELAKSPDNLRARLRVPPYLPAFPPAYTYSHIQEDTDVHRVAPAPGVSAQQRRATETALANILSATKNAAAAEKRRQQLQEQEREDGQKSDEDLGAGALSYDAELYAPSLDDTVFAAHTPSTLASFGWDLPPAPPVRKVVLGPDNGYVRSVELSRFAPPPPTPDTDVTLPDKKELSDLARAQELLAITYAHDLVQFETTAAAVAGSQRTVRVTGSTAAASASVLSSGGVGGAPAGVARGAAAAAASAGAPSPPPADMEDLMVEEL